MKTTVAFAVLFHVALAQDTETTTPPLFWGDGIIRFKNVLRAVSHQPF